MIYPIEPPDGGAPALRDRGGTYWYDHNNTFAIRALQIKTELPLARWLLLQELCPLVTGGAVPARRGLVRALNPAWSRFSVRTVVPRNTRITHRLLTNAAFNGISCPWVTRDFRNWH